jgi:hypothetical protein
MASSSRAPQSYADGLKGILDSIVGAMSAPDADMRTLLGLQMGVLGAIKAGPGGGQPGGAQPGGTSGPPGMSQGQPGGMPGGPAQAGGGAMNPMQQSPQPPRGMMAQPGMGSMMQDPDELRRMIQQKVGA